MIHATFCPVNSAEHMCIRSRLLATRRLAAAGISIQLLHQQASHPLLPTPKPRI